MHLLLSRSPMINIYLLICDLSRKKIDVKNMGLLSIPHFLNNIDRFVSPHQVTFVIINNHQEINAQNPNDFKANKIQSIT